MYAYFNFMEALHDYLFVSFHTHLLVYTPGVLVYDPQPRILLL